MLTLGMIPIVQQFREKLDADPLHPLGEVVQAVRPAAVQHGGEEEAAGQIENCQENQGGKNY